MAVQPKPEKKCCGALPSKLFRLGKRASKDSIVYFQANDDMDNHNHLNQQQHLYDPASDAVIPPVPSGQININIRERENQQHLLEPLEPNVNIYYHHSNQMISPMHYANHQQVFINPNAMLTTNMADHRPPESVISGSDTNNSSANSKQQFFLTNRYLNAEPVNTYESQHYLLQSQSHTNPAALIYYDSSVASSHRNQRASYQSSSARI